MEKITKADGKRVGDVKMYALSTCGWCRKTKRFFEDNGIAFSCVYVDLLSEGERDAAVGEQRRLNPSGSFPTIVVNGWDVIIGYDLDALNKLAGTV